MRKIILIQNKKNNIQNKQKNIRVHYAFFCCYFSLNVSRSIIIIETMISIMNKNKY